MVGFLAALSQSTLFIQHVDQGVGGAVSRPLAAGGPGDILTSARWQGWGGGISGAACTLRSSWKPRVRRTGFPPGPRLLAPLLSTRPSAPAMCRVREVAVFLQEIKQLHSPQSQPGTCLKFPEHFQMHIRKEDRLVVDQKTSISLCPRIGSWVSRRDLSSPGPHAELTAAFHTIAKRRDQGPLTDE